MEGVEHNLKFSLFPRTHTCVVSALRMLCDSVGASASRAIESAGSHFLALLGARTPRRSTRTVADLVALPRPAHVTTGRGLPAACRSGLGLLMGWVQMGLMGWVFKWVHSGWVGMS
jgi:hypothetical protein